jgi:hypothetical protein
MQVTRYRGRTFGDCTVDSWRARGFHVVEVPMTKVAAESWKLMAYLIRFHGNNATAVVFLGVRIGSKFVTMKRNRTA